MSNTDFSSTSLSTEIVRNANLFNEFLESDTVAPVRKSIHLIPDIVADILDYALQRKTLKNQKAQFERKADLAESYIKALDRHSQRQLEQQITTIRIQTEVNIAEIHQKRDIELAHIKSNECIRLAEIHTQYELTRQKQETQKTIMLKAMQESNYRFNQQMDSINRVQKELDVLINSIMKRVSQKKATEYEYKLLEHLTALKVQTLDKTFNISEGFMDVFSQGA